MRALSPRRGARGAGMKSRTVLLTVGIASAVAAALVAALLTNIFQRKQEAKNP